MPQDGKLTAGRYGTTRKSGNAAQRGLQSAVVAFPAPSNPPVRVREPRAGSNINARSNGNAEQSSHALSTAPVSTAPDLEQPLELVDRAANAVADSMLMFIRPVIRRKSDIHTHPHRPNRNGRGFAKVRADLLDGLVTISELANGYYRDIAARYNVVERNANRIIQAARERRIELPPQWQDKAK